MRTNTEQIQNKYRSYLFDNFKAILIFFVVFGHCLDLFQGIWDKECIRITWQYIFLFHMPGFAFVSGYFAKKNDVNIFQKTLEKQIVPVIFFHFAFEIFNKILFKVFTGATLILTPAWTFWYMLSLAFWKISFQLLYKIKFILPISIVMSLGVGIVDCIGYPLSASRTIVLFPFFLLGHFFKERNIIEKIKSKRFFLGLALTTLLGSYIWVWKMKFPIGLYLNSCSYNICGFSWKRGGLLRLVNLFLAFAVVLSIIILTPPKKSFLSEIGRNSIIPYIAHGFLLKLLVKLLYLHCFEPFFEFYTNVYFTYIGGSLFSATIIYIFGKDYAAKIYDKLIKQINKFAIKEI